MKQHVHRSPTQQEGGKHASASPAPSASLTTKPLLKLIEGQFRCRTFSSVASSNSGKTVPELALPSVSQWNSDQGSGRTEPAPVPSTSTTTPTQGLGLRCLSDSRWSCS